MMDEGPTSLHYQIFEIPTLYVKIMQIPLCYIHQIDVTFIRIFSIRWLYFLFHQEHRKTCVTFRYLCTICFDLNLNLDEGTSPVVSKQCYTFPVTFIRLCYICQINVTLIKVSFACSKSKNKCKLHPYNDQVNPQMSSAPVRQCYKQSYMMVNI